MAHIVLLSVASHTHCQPKMKSVSVLKTASIISNFILLHKILKFPFYFHRYYVSIFVYLLSFNSFDKFVNNQFMTMKYSEILLSLLLCFCFKIVCKFNACRHLPYFEYFVTTIQYVAYMPYLKITFEYHQIPIIKQHAFFNIRYTFIHSSRWFVILAYTIERRERKKTWNDMRYFFVDSEFQSNIIISFPSTCMSTIPRDFFYFQKKERNPYLAWIYFVCSCSKRERETEILKLNISSMYYIQDLCEANGLFMQQKN